MSIILYVHETTGKRLGTAKTKTTFDGTTKLGKLRRGNVLQQEIVNIQQCIDGMIRLREGGRILSRTLPLLTNVGNRVTIFVPMIQKFRDKEGSI